MPNGNKTVIEITDTHIKWLQGKRQRSAFVVASIIIKKLENHSAGNVVEDLSAFFPIKKRASPKGTMSLVDAEAVVFIIPRRCVILKQILLPSEIDEEIRRMVDLQLTQYVPYGREEVSFDFSLLGKGSEGYTKILAVFVQQDKVKQDLHTLSKIGLHPQQCGLSSFGIVDWFLYHEKENVAALCLINVDYAHCEICFCQGRKLLFSRHIPLGSRDLQEGSLENLVEQIGLTMEAYRKESMGDDIREIKMIAAIPQATLLKEKLAGYYSIPITLLSSLDQIPYEKNFDAKIFQEHEGVSITAALGFLLADASLSPNLIPADVQHAKQSRLRRRIFSRTIFLLIVIIVSGIGAWGVNIYKDHLYLRKIQTQIGKLKTNISQTEKRMQSLLFFRDQIQNQVFVADIIKELYNLTPPEIAFYSLFLDAAGALTIQGYAGDTGSSINQFQNQLVGSNLFKEVRLQYQTNRKRGNEEYTDFKITCALASKEKPLP